MSRVEPIADEVIEEITEETTEEAPEVVVKKEVEEMPEVTPASRVEVTPEIAPAKGNEQNLAILAYSLVNKPPYTVESVLNSLPEGDRETVMEILERIRAMPMVSTPAPAGNLVAVGLAEPRLSPPVLSGPRL